MTSHMKNAHIKMEAREEEGTSEVNGKGDLSEEKGKKKYLKKLKRLKKL